MGFLYLVAIARLVHRKAGWRISNTLEAGFCIRARQGDPECSLPEIANTDQGSQFRLRLDRPSEQVARISMDSKGRCLDNIFIERLAVPEVRMRICTLGDRCQARGRRRALDPASTTWPRPQRTTLAMVCFNQIATDQQGIK
ncbi:MAG: hypothetical protein H6880_05050 [Rhodobiaceae bacterium]|nr:hypothetical protein [Rhodobiaceae bacterium]